MIQTINEASDAIAGGRAQRSPVSLSNGESIQVGKLRWNQFKPLWSRLQGAVIAVINNMRAERYLNSRTAASEYAYASGGLELGEVKIGAMTPEQTEATARAIREDVSRAETTAAQAFTAMVNHISGAPELLEDLISGTTSLTREQMAELEFDDIIRLAGEAIQVNFLENKELLDFLSAAVKAFTGEQEPGPGEQSETAAAA